MVGYWGEGGEARAAVTGNPDDGLRAMLQGLGSLSYGELAGERMKLGLLLHDPEEEHDCFSDNTHNSHYYDIAGMLAVYDGRYERIDGSVVEGPSLADLVAGSRSRPRERDAGCPRPYAGRGPGPEGARPTAARWPTTRCWPRTTRRATP